MTKATENQEVVQNEVAVTEEAQAPAISNFFAGFDLAELGMSEEELKALSGLDAIDSSEVRIPYATLHNKDTREYKKGDIVFPDGSVIHGADKETVAGISVLKIQPVRVYFPTPFNPNNSFICRSLDGNVGAPDGEYAGRACDSCEFAQYPQGGGASPCRDQRLLLCTKEDGSLFHIQIGGVGIKTWKTFMSAQVFHLLPKAGGILGALKTTMGVKIVDTDFGPFAALDFNIDPKDPFVTKERFKTNLDAYKAYKEFEKENIETAATQSRVQFANGGDEGAQTGQNAQLF